MKKIAMAATAVAILMTGDASAADMAPRYTKAPAPIPSPVYDWSGFYVGLNAGGAWNRTDVSATPNAAFAGDFSGTTAFIAANHPSRLNKDGFTGGGQAGYNWQRGQFLLGVEADINFVDSKRSFAFGAGNVVPLSVTGSVATDWLATFRGRVGLAANNVLLYATGGFGVAELKYDETVAVTGNVSGLG